VTGDKPESIKEKPVREGGLAENGKNFLPAQQFLYKL
jgi:hypothetical protein